MKYIVYTMAATFFLASCSKDIDETGGGNGTERTEKEALKLYLAHYGTMQEAITHIEADRKRDGGHKYLEFARKVNQHQKVMSLWSS